MNKFCMSGTVSHFRKAMGLDSLLLWGTSLCWQYMSSALECKNPTLTNNTHNFVLAFVYDHNKTPFLFSRIVSQARNGLLSPFTQPGGINMYYFQQKDCGRSNLLLHKCVAFIYFISFKKKVAEFGCCVSMRRKRGGTTHAHFWGSSHFIPDKRGFPIHLRAAASLTAWNLDPLKSNFNSGTSWFFPSFDVRHELGGLSARRHGGEIASCPWILTQPNQLLPHLLFIIAEWDTHRPLTVRNISTKVQISCVPSLPQKNILPTIL